MKLVKLSVVSSLTLAVFLIFGGTHAFAETQPFDFTLSQEIQTDLGPFGLLADDFNKDGNTDLLIGHTSAHTFSILSGSDSGLFTGTNQSSDGGASMDLASGDFNEDGILDFVGAGDGIRVFLGNTDGSFVGISWLISNIGSPSTVATEDINKDGHLDIIAAGGKDKIAIFFGDGSGNFSFYTSLTTISDGSNSGISEVGIGDFNEDGNLDIAAYNEVGDSNVFVFFGDGTGGFSSPRTFVGAVSGKGLDVIDINKDGHLDILSEGSVDNLIYVFLGDGAGHFTRKTSFVGGVKAKNIAIADFDGDGSLDIVAPEANYNVGKIDISKGNGDGTFTFVKSIAIGGGPRTAVAGDFNKDGFVDFAVNDPSNVNNKTYIFLNHPNQAPALDPIGNKTVNEGEALTFTVHATDPDGDALTYSASNLPVGATFSTTTGIFSWTPSYNQSGNYTDIEFSVMDNGMPMQLDSELITITVGNINRPPVFIPVGSQEVLENQSLEFTVSATDPDGDAVVFSAANLPVGATFNPDSVTFLWMPDNTQSGVYIVTFVALDNGSPVASNTLEVPVTVGDVPTPVEQANNLVSTVISDAISTNVENSYLANLRKIAIFIEDGKIGAAINQLSAFIHKVQTDVVSGVITQAEGDELVALANGLLSDLQ